MKKTICLITGICIFILAACMKDEPLKQAYHGYEPEVINDGWAVSSPEAENMDVSLIEKAYRLIFQENRYLMARSLLVFRNNKLVAEVYPNDTADMHKVSNIQSMTKSVTSLLTGIALQNNHITDINEKLYNIYPEYFDDVELKKSITIEHALTMRTGLYFDNSQNTKELYNSSQSVEYVLKQACVDVPGLVMNYNDGAPQLVSKVIELKTGSSLSQYGEKYLFNPLGIKDWKWEAATDGTTFGAFSLYLKPRDLGKIGSLLLQNGQWDGKQLVDPDYLSEAINSQTENDKSEPYGYYFWILPEWNAYYAYGHGGQFLLVVPDKELVVVYTAWPYTGSLFFDDPKELMNLIIESCR